MPTLLAVNSYFYRRDGSEALYFDHNRLFEAAGWDVVPFAMQHPSNLDSPWSSFFVSEMEFGRPYSLGEKISRVPKVIYSLEARRKLSSLLDQVAPTLCHCHSIYHHLSPSILSLLRQRSRPIVMTLHDLKLACPAYHMFNRGAVCERCKGGRFLEVIRGRCIKGSLALSTVIAAEALLHQVLRTYAENVDRFVVPCRYYAEKLVEWRWPREQLVHIPNFLDPSLYQADFRPGTGFLYFGRLSPEKGLDILVRAAAKAKVALSLAGHGPQGAQLQALADNLGADVRMLGYLQGRRLHQAVREARATLLPAVWYENAPISVLESYALGKPVIVSDIGGLPEMVEDGVTGRLVAAGSVDDLADALHEFSNISETSLEHMGRQARQLVERRYSPSSYFASMLDLYRGLTDAA